MKTSIFMYAGFSFLLMSACKDDKRPVDVEPDVETKILNQTPAKPVKMCFLYAVDKDSISFNIEKIDEHVRGDLNFNFYQLDGSWGTFEGLMNGDTLRGIYDFEAEGTKSKRELIFLKKGDTLIHGKGETELSGNTELFKKDANITFEGGNVLLQIACKTTEL